MNRKTLPLSIAAALLLCVNLLPGQYSSSPQGQTATQNQADAKAEHRLPNANIKATLLNKDANARKQEADVKVTVTGLKLTDPDSAREQAKAGEGHIHYRVDDGPTIATTATKLDFHDLKPGTHKITVMLAGNDHTPLGPEETISVDIPASSATR